MTTRELLEMTVLDSLGLLEPQEQEAFEQSFAEASPAIREQVRFEQARLADLTAMLPSVEPRAEIRGQVLDAVRQAIAEQEAAKTQEARRSRHTPGRSVPKLARGPRVSWVWRAATIGLAVSVAVLGVALTQYQMDFNRLENNLRMAQLEEFVGVEHLDELLFDPNTNRAFLTSLDGASDARASVWHNPDNNVAQFYYKNLGAETGSGSFRLVVLDEDDNVVREVVSFTSQGRSDVIEVRVDLLNESRLGLMQVADDQSERLEFRSDGLASG